MKYFVFLWATSLTLLCVCPTYGTSQSPRRLSRYATPQPRTAWTGQMGVEALAINELQEDACHRASVHLVREAGYVSSGKLSLRTGCNLSGLDTNFLPVLGCIKLIGQ